MANWPPHTIWTSPPPLASLPPRLRAELSKREQQLSRQIGSSSEPQLIEILWNFSHLFSITQPTPITEYDRPVNSNKRLKMNHLLNSAWRTTKSRKFENLSHPNAPGCSNGGLRLAPWPNRPIIRIFPNLIAASANSRTSDWLQLSPDSMANGPDPM